MKAAAPALIWLSLAYSNFGKSVASGPQSGLRRKLDELTEPCTLLHRETWNEKHSGLDNHHKTMDCELQDGSRILEIHGLDMDQVSRNHSVVSGETTIFASDAVIREDRLEFPSNAVPVFGRATNVQHSMDSEQGITGNRTVLVVRVVGPDASTTRNEATTSDQVFGTRKDEVNLASQMRACSHGKLQMVPTQDFKGGVYSVQISDSVIGSRESIVRNSVTSQLVADLGNVAARFDHVMYCLPPGTEGDWIAYSYTNHWLSVYNDQRCNHVSVQMHEIAHNLGLGHSGMGDDVVGDQSGMMGFSYGLGNSPLMCYNGPKTWALGWFRDRQVTFDFFASSSWNGQLVGASDYNNSTGRFVVVKIVGDAMYDYYINFNRKTAPNTGTRDGADKVLVTYVPREGVAPPSTRIAAMTTAGRLVLEDFAGSNHPLIVHVNKIILGHTFIGYTDITITGHPPATPAPTPLPTLAPTGMPTTMMVNGPTQSPTGKAFEAQCTCRRVPVSR